MLKLTESPQSNTLDTTVSAPVGERYKDEYAKRLRAGDLEAAIYLSECYEVCGERSEAQIVIDDLLTNDLSPELRARALMKKAAQQKDSPAIAWKTINRAPLEDVSKLVRGKLHNQRARILKELKKFDPAIIEYTAAAYYFELCESPEMIGLARNNMSSIYRHKKRFKEAHESVDAAIKLWRTFQYLPQALDQKALIYVDEKRYQQAHDLAVSAVDKAGDRHGWKAEFLATLSKAQAGLGLYVDSMLSIDQALEICDYLGNEHLRLLTLASRKTACEILHQHAVKNSLSFAMKLTGGNIRQAAKKLGINHSTVRKSRDAHSL